MCITPLEEIQNIIESHKRLSELIESYANQLGSSILHMSFLTQLLYNYKECQLRFQGSS